MLGYRAFVLIYAVLGILLNESYSSEERAECTDVKNLHVLDTCCDIPDEDQMTEEEKALVSMCDKTVYGDRTARTSTSDDERLKLIECMEECFYNGTHLLTDEMKLNETALIADYNVQVQNSPQWKVPIEKAVKKCIEKNVVSEVKPEAKCKSGAYQFTSCFGLNLQLNCPPENWKTDDEKCMKAREILQKC